jgi:ferredoxin
MGDLIYLSGVSTLHLHEEKCIGCGMCLAVCPHAVFFLDGSKAAIRNLDRCMECGACAMNCPVAAIEVEANVGCARAVINSMLGRQSSSCCCVVEPKQNGRSAAVRESK